MAIKKKFNIEAVNDYPPIRFERKFAIRRSLRNAESILAFTLMFVSTYRPTLKADI